MARMNVGSSRKQHMLKKEENECGMTRKVRRVIYTRWWLRRARSARVSSRNEIVQQYIHPASKKANRRSIMK
jgi:hypothetical protein